MASALPKTPAAPPAPTDQFEPTPPIGMPIQWFERGLTDSGPKAAIVTQIERPGVVQIAVTSPFAEPRHYKGVRHIKAAQKQPHDMQTMRSGGWDFVPGLTPPDPTKLHRDETERKELARMQEEEDRVRRQKEEAARLREEAKEEFPQPVTA